MRLTAVEVLGIIAEQSETGRPPTIEFLRNLASSAHEDQHLRVAAATGLLPHGRPDDQRLLLQLSESAGFLRPGASAVPVPPVPMKTEGFAMFLVDWMDFYTPERLAARATERAHAKEDDRWNDAFLEDEPWVERELRAIDDRYSATIQDLPDRRREHALAVARAMMDFAVRGEGRAPWRWNPDKMGSCFAHCVGSQAFQDPGLIRRIPDHILRFVRFWETEGKIAADDRRQIEEFVSEERERLVEMAIHPEGWDPAESLVGLPQGAEADPIEATPDRAEPKTARNAPCPCGSGKKFKRCCGK